MDTNSIINQAIELVGQAVQADQAQDYDKALGLYRDALSRFTMALKYEKNDARRKLLLERVEEYMKRAEELKELTSQKENAGNKNTSSPSGKSGSGSSAADDDKKTGDGNKKEMDEDTKKIRGALSGVILAEKPDVKWDDVAGLENAKESLKETVILPVKFPMLFTGKRVPFKGILLYGPPGTGKSFLAQAVATESDSTFFTVSSADLISKWQGESERLVKNLFEMARETEGGNAIIFIDEVESLCGTRGEGESDSMRRVKTEFLVQMDGVGKSQGGGRVLILGATNVPWQIDSAIRRRFEKRVYIPLPEAGPRTVMLKLHMGDTPNNLTDADLDRLGKLTEGASGADIKVLVKEAMMEPIKRCQQAKQFTKDADGNYMPCDRYPNCAYCPPKLSTDPPNMDYTCSHCGALRMTLWDIPTEECPKLQCPQVTIKDFEKVLRHAFSTVSADELKRYADWTAMFGQDGA